MKLEIPCLMDDLPLSPEAIRVYFAIARSVAEYQEFPSVERITSRCFGKRYALGSTHTNLAMCELKKWNLISGEPGDYTVTDSDEWKLPGGAA